MASGNEIVVTSCGGRKGEGIIYGSGLKPGIVMQLRAAVAAVDGSHTWEPYNRDANGNRPQGPIAVLDIDSYQGKTADHTYNDGDRCFLWFPIPGDKLNVRVSDAAGTGSASDFGVGDILTIVDGTGKLVLSTGSVEIEPFIALEALADLTSDDLLHVQFSGY